MKKIDLITGFLGSGKTTFLLKYARFLMEQGLKIEILVYDYGAINVDMLLLNQLRGPKCEIEMIAAACDEDCLKRRFTSKLIAMAMSGYDRVIIEPSGVFDMDMFFDALRDDPLENWYEIGSVIAIVNPQIDDNLSPEEDYLLSSQSACAGVILFSRVQLSLEDQIRKATEHLERALENIQCKNHCTEYISKNWDDLTDDDYQRIMNSGYRITDYVKTIAGKELSFSTKCYLNLKDSPDEIINKVKTLFSSPKYGNIMRIKGFACGNEGGYQINASRSEFLAAPISIGQGVLIVIGTELNTELIDEVILG